MKKLVLFAFCLCSAVAFAQDNTIRSWLVSAEGATKTQANDSTAAFAKDEVSLVVSADGATKTQAIDNALRSAIEQTFGTFVSANTEILNDELVRDEIATVSIGNIQRYTEIAAVTLPNGNTSVMLNVTVSLAKLISYAQSKGSECEFAGATFGANLRLYEFNKKNERIAIENMIKQLDALRPFYDYKLVMNDPVLNKDGRTARVSFTVEVINNDKTEMAYKIIENTFNSLALTQEQVDPMLKAGFSFQQYWFYFGKYKTGIIQNDCQHRYLYNIIPEEICYYLFSTFCDFKISDNNGGIFFCEINPLYHKDCFGNCIEIYENEFLYYEPILGRKWIVLFTQNYSLVSGEINCDVPIEDINKINKVSIEPSLESPGTKIIIGYSGRYSKIRCSYIPHE